MSEFAHDFSADAILQHLLASGTIDLDGVADSMNKAKRKKILEKHNFEYGVNSKLNKGSEFYFKVPKEK